MQSDDFIFDEDKRQEILENCEGDNTKYSKTMLYEVDTCRDRTYAEPDNPKINSDHNHLKDIDFNKPSVDDNNRFDYDNRQSLTIEGKDKYNNASHIKLDITVPPNNPFKELETSRLFIFLCDNGGGSLWGDISALKRKDRDTVHWIFNKNYTISMDWENMKNAGWKTRPPAVLLKEVLQEIGNVFRIPDRVFVIGHSRGGMSGVDCLIAHPKLSNNYILSSPYFIHPPGKQETYSLIDIERFPTFLKVMNENKFIRIIMQGGRSDYFLNMTYAMMFLCKGSFREEQLQIILDDKTYESVKEPLFGRKMCRLQMMAFNVELELKKENIIIEEPPQDYYNALYHPLNPVQFQ